MTRIAMTIAGSDSSGGAGIQADIKTFGALGVYGTCAITSLTAQNTKEVRAVLPIEPAFVARQIETVFDDIAIHAVKTGMMAEGAIVEAVANALIKTQAQNIVVDPVIFSSTGAALLNPEGVETLIDRLLPIASVVTPNIAEAQRLSGMKISTMEDMKEAAERIAALGPKSAVITGGHADGGDVTDVFYNGGDIKIFKRSRIENPNNHGSGCVFASAVAAYLAKGEAVAQAVRLAGDFTARAIAAGFSIGEGAGPADPLSAGARGG